METSKVLIIAEAGVNHNGDEHRAFELVDQAVAAGADCVKFQTFKAHNLVTKTASLADYQKENGVKENSQFAMLKKLELGFDIHVKLVEYCQQKNITFLSTAFDFESLDFLINVLKLPMLKIPSGEVTNAPFVLAHAHSGKPLIISTGMCSLDEVAKALSVVAFGLCNVENNTLDNTPSEKAFKQAFASEQGQRLLNQHVTLLHCTTDYPAAPKDINLHAMNTLKDSFSVKVGYSDHSEGIVVPIAAVANGACVIEKHFTTDKNLPGPDHKASLDPTELKTMVDAIRLVEQAMGTGIKEATTSELKNKLVARKSLVAGQRIKQGDKLTPENIHIKRPGSGKSPYEYWDLLNTLATKDYEIGDLLI
ncbi:N-acetylneuraminate synthase [Colwellia sp. RE-S-Sl-9]